MLPYCLLRPLVFALEPEAAHDLTLKGLQTLGRSGLTPTYRPLAAAPVEAMGLSFPNRIGLAAGLDKDGIAVDALASWGFGFIEVGTVTPRPQPGNPKPRLFRLPQAQALINRMGFNNDGVAALLAHLEHTRYRGILGINIGKNFDTPIERAVDDYLACLDQVYARASYVAVNISSPNTQNLRTLQSDAALEGLLAALKARQTALAQQHGRMAPLVLKIAPDLDDEHITALAAAVRRHRIDAVIATNTTVAREGVAHLAHGSESGGLSGAPLFTAATAVVRKLAQALQGETPIIAAGGVMSGADARAKLEAGATLVQVYTGLIYRGPALVKECVEAVSAKSTNLQSNFGQKYKPTK